jgi:hypothetical protein
MTTLHVVYAYNSHNQHIYTNNAASLSHLHISRSIHPSPQERQGTSPTAPSPSNPDNITPPDLNKGEEYKHTSRQHHKKDEKLRNTAVNFVANAPTKEARPPSSLLPLFLSSVIGNPSLRPGGETISSRPTHQIITRDEAIHQGHQPSSQIKPDPGCQCQVRSFPPQSNPTKPTTRTGRSAVWRGHAVSVICRERGSPTVHGEQRRRQNTRHYKREMLDSCGKSRRRRLANGGYQLRKPLHAAVPHRQGMRSVLPSSRSNL